MVFTSKKTYPVYPYHYLRQDYTGSTGYHYIETDRRVGTIYFLGEDNGENSEGIV
jgi:hypothetical protein